VSEKIKNLEKELSEAHPDRYIPRFTYNNEITKRAIGTGDYRPLYDHEKDAYRFQFKKKVKWDNELSMQLTNIVNESKKYTIPSFWFSELGKAVNRYTSLPKDVFDDNFVILKIDNDKFNVYDIESRLRENDYKPFSVLDSETKEQAMERFPEVIQGFVNEDSITAKLEFIEDGHQLIEDIGKTFFDANTE